MEHTRVVAGQETLARRLRRLKNLNELLSKEDRERLQQDLAEIHRKTHPCWVKS